MPRKKTNNTPNKAVKKVEPVIVGGETSMNAPQNEKLQKELQWCIEQLRLSLMTQKSSQKQVQESVRIIKILSSTSAPLVKKRQMMRQTFGDYRKKIEDEDAKWMKETQRLEKKVTISDPLSTKSGLFLRCRKQVIDDEDNLEKVFKKCSVQDAEEETELTENINHEFKFNFKIDGKT